MLIGVPREIKPQERRVALTPDAVGDLTASGVRATRRSCGLISRGTPISMACS